MSKRRRRQKLPSEPVTAHIESLSHDGRGIAHIDGKITFIRNALPGETVACQYTKKRGKFDEGQAIEIITPSPNRAIPHCPHYDICGGCSQQHLTTDFQLQHKQQVLLDQLQHFGQVTPQEIVPPITGPIWGYRQKARLGVRFVIKKDKVLVGFRERNGRYLAELTKCPVLHPSVGEKLLALATLIESFEHRCHIPQIEVAVGDDQTALVFRHLKPFSTTEQQDLCEFGQQHQLDMYLQPGNTESIHKIYPTDTPDRLSYTFPDRSLTLQFHPSDFTQVNATINQKMVTRALDWLELQPQEQVLDLFCGLGNFTLPIAQHVQQVIGVEGSAKMVERAQENATNNHITNATFHAADLTQDITHRDWHQTPFTKVLLDPPRSGAAELLPQLNWSSLARIVYISCNPATLARDAGTLVHQHGFVLQKTGIMDMFPHTSHVESVALFLKP